MSDSDDEHKDLEKPLNDNDDDRKNDFGVSVSTLQKLFNKRDMDLLKELGGT